MSINIIYASENITSDVLQDDTQVNSMESVENVEINRDSTNSINIHVQDSYSQINNTWSEDGFDLEGATVNVYDDLNNIVSSQKTNSKGIALITNLASSKYKT